MVWVVGISVLVGLLLIASGVGTLRTGWVLPSARRHVARPKLYGLRALFMVGRRASSSAGRSLLRT
ncbi:hypothetical protein SUDANB132_04197 [Streptomyces sp. enrichment culture]